VARQCLVTPLRAATSTPVLLRRGCCYCAEMRCRDWAAYGGRRTSRAGAAARVMSARQQNSDRPLGNSLSAGFSPAGRAGPPTRNARSSRRPTFRPTHPRRQLTTRELAQSFITDRPASRLIIASPSHCLHTSLPCQYWTGLRPCDKSGPK